MKVFLACSAGVSERVAELMRDWLPLVVPSIQPFVSPRNARKDPRRQAETRTDWREAGFALICLAPDNLASRWIHFESGTAAQLLDHARISALLLDVTPEQIEPPLQQFRCTPLAKRDLWTLVQNLNRLCVGPLAETQLRKRFDQHYPEADAAIRELRNLLTRQATEVSSKPKLAPNKSAAYKRALSRELGTLLRERRVEFGFSQSELSSCSRVDRTYISQIERGIRSPTIAILFRLSHAMDTAPALLITLLNSRLQ